MKSESPFLDVTSFITDETSQEEAEAPIHARHCVGYMPCFLGYSRI
jgi:hypothetical protein